MEWARRYGLGVRVSSSNGHRVLEHGGEVLGFIAENIVMPDDKIAVVVLTNQDASEAAGGIGETGVGTVAEGRDSAGPEAG